MLAQQQETFATMTEQIIQQTSSYLTATTINVCLHAILPAPKSVIC